jgi:hypothetical protein
VAAPAGKNRLPVHSRLHVVPSLNKGGLQLVQLLIDISQVLQFELHA